MKYKLSIFTHFVAVNEMVDAIYHTLSGEVVYCKKALSQKLQSHYTGRNINENDNIISGEFIDVLIKKNFIVDFRINEADRLYNQPYQSIEIALMYIVFSLKCNLKCNYCFLKENKGSYKTVLADKNIYKGIKLFKKLTKNIEKPQIILYGGEPTLHYNKVMKTITWIRSEMGEKVIINLLSNGYKINKDLALFLKKYNVVVALSIDGPLLLNDKQRLSPNGESSFELFSKAFYILVQNGIMPSLSITLTEYNINNLMESTKWLLNNFKINSLAFNLLVGQAYKDLNNSKKYIYSATIEMLKAFEILRERGIYEDRIMRKLEVFKSKGIHLKDCGGRGSQIVLAPDGKIGPCQGFLGNNHYFPLSCESIPSDIYNNSMFLKWSKNYPLKNKDCYSCKAIAICGGGCIYNSWLCTNKYQQCEDRMKMHNIMFVDWALKDLYKHSRLYARSNGNIHEFT